MFRAIGAGVCWQPTTGSLLILAKDMSTSKTVCPAFSLLSSPITHQYTKCSSPVTSQQKRPGKPGLFLNGRR